MGFGTIENIMEMLVGAGDFSHSAADFLHQIQETLSCQNLSKPILSKPVKKTYQDLSKSNRWLLSTRNWSDVPYAHYFIEYLNQHSACPSCRVRTALKETVLFFKKQKKTNSNHPNERHQFRITGEWSFFPRLPYSSRYLILYDY